MTEPRQIMERFREHRANLAADTGDQQLYADTIFGIGLLLGGGWPGAAAAVAVLADARFLGRVSPWRIE